MNQQTLCWLGCELKRIVYFAELVGLVSLSPSQGRQELKGKGLPSALPGHQAQELQGFVLFGSVTGHGLRQSPFPENGAKEQEHG